MVYLLADFAVLGFVGLAMLVKGALKCLIIGLQPTYGPADFVNSGHVTYLAGGICGGPGGMTPLETNPKTMYDASRLCRINLDVVGSK